MFEWSDFCDVADELAKIQKKHISDPQLTDTTIHYLALQENI